MRVAIASDIHGNKHAFEAVIAAAEGEGVEELWCLGDLVGYGGDPGRLGRARQAPLRRRAGRQPRSRRRRRPVAGGVLARRRARRPVDARRDPARDARLPALAAARRARREGVGLFHASPRDPVWEYVLSGLTAELCFDVTDYRVSLIGHSHVALSFDRQEGTPASGTTRKEGTELDIAHGPVADQPRLDRPAARRRPPRRLAAARHRQWTAVYRRAEYDIAGADGGDPGRQPAGLARRAAAARSVKTAPGSLASVRECHAAPPSRSALLLATFSVGACGSEDPELIPQSRASQLSATVDEIVSACEDERSRRGACRGRQGERSG